jgi:release factor glutamine methyltransferase
MPADVIANGSEVGWGRGSLVPSGAVRQLLGQAAAALSAAGIESAGLDAEVLLATACGVGRAWLYAQAGEEPPPPATARFRHMLERRLTREPLAYIIGRREFWSLDFTVTSDVLIPRPETETLVARALRVCRQRGGEERPLALCDVGTGSGCIAVALATELLPVQVWALDMSVPALAVARANAAQHGVGDRVRFMKSDLFAAVGGQGFDVIVSNPPYVASADLGGLAPEVRCEPRLALDGGAAGLVLIERLLRGAAAVLREGGALLVEMDAGQESAVRALAAEAGWQRVTVEPDDAGRPRVLVAER